MLEAHVLNPSHTLYVLILFSFTSKNFLIFPIALTLTLGGFGGWLCNVWWVSRNVPAAHFCFYLVTVLEHNLTVSPLFVFPLPSLHSKDNPRVFLHSSPLCALCGSFQWTAVPGSYFLRSASSIRVNVLVGFL